MRDEPIQFFNRYTQRVETETVYGDGFLRWTYGNPLGRLALHLLVKRALFSRWYGWRMDRPASRAKVMPFIKEFGLDVNEFADAPESFRTFNEFFYRNLKPEARPIDPDPNTAVFPADGRHLGFQNISKMEGIFVKGEIFDLAELLKDDELASRYVNGLMILSRLCPVDYHRFHFPVGGKVSETRLINGPLFSVNPIALKQNIHIFTQNKRWTITIDSEKFGKVTFIAVGATCVGSAEFTFKPGSTIKKGDEAGYFRFGGSSTITLFEPDRIHLAEDLVSCSRQRQELYAKVRDAAGSISS